MFQHSVISRQNSKAAEAVLNSVIMKKKSCSHSFDVGSHRNLVVLGRGSRRDSLAHIRSCCVPDIQYVRHLIFIAIKLSAVSTKLYLLTMVTVNDAEAIEIKDAGNLFFLKLGVQPNSVTNLKIVFFRHLLFVPLFLYFSLIILILLYFSLFPLSLVTP